MKMAIQNKKEFDGSVARYKARLVAKGFSQNLDLIFKIPLAMLLNLQLSALYLPLH